MDYEQRIRQLQVIRNKTLFKHLWLFLRRGSSIKGGGSELIIGPSDTKWFFQPSVALNQRCYHFNFL